MESLLKTVHLTAAKIASLITTNYESVTSSTNNRSRKRMGEINHDENDEWKEIVFPAFDLHMHRISFGNGNKRISTIAFEFRCHPDNASILKTLLSRISSDDKTPSSEKNCPFCPLWINLIFLSRMLPSSNNYVIIIFNIDSEIMYSKLLPSLKQDRRFKGIGRTHSTDSDEMDNHYD